MLAETTFHSQMKNLLLEQLYRDKTSILKTSETDSLLLIEKRLIKYYMRFQGSFKTNVSFWTAWKEA